LETKGKEQRSREDIESDILALSGESETRKDTLQKKHSINLYFDIQRGGGKEKGNEAGGLGVRCFNVTEQTSTFCDKYTVGESHEGVS